MKNRRRKALNTVKKLPYFGHSSFGRYPIDFEWPTKEEILAMPLDKPIRAVAFKWHNSDYEINGRYIGAI